MSAYRRLTRIMPALLLFCGACNIGVPRLTPTPPPLRTPRVTLSPRPTIADPLATDTALPPTEGPSPFPLASPTPSPTALAFVLRQTPIAPTAPAPTPSLLPARTSLPLITLSPNATPNSGAPTVLASGSTVGANQLSTPFPTAPPTVALRVTLAPQLPRNWQLTPVAGNLSELTLRSYSIDGGGNLTGGILSDLPGAPTFARENPNSSHSVQYAARNSLGSLYFIHRDGRTERLAVSPASTFEANDAPSNRAFIADVSWSTDGQRLSLLIHSDFSEEDGVWWMRPGLSNPERLLVDCPHSQHPGCLIVDRTLGPYAWRTRTVQWSPGGETLLARVDIYDPVARPALALLQPGRDYNQLPPFLYYDFGSWLADGGLLASGSGPDGRNVVAILSPTGELRRELYTDPALPLRYANEAANGQIYALGRRDGQLALYQLTNGRAQIVGTPRALPWPEFAHWDSARGTLDLTIAGRVETFYTSPGAVPPAPSQSGLPASVETGAQFAPGEQLRIRSATLNFRADPSLSGEIIATLQQGEYVRVLAGPHQNGAEIWWQAQDAAGRIGWLANESDGQPLLERDAAG